MVRVPPFDYASQDVTVQSMINTSTQAKPEYLNYEVTMIFKQDLIVHVSLNFNNHQSTPDDPEVQRLIDKPRH